MKKKIKHNYRDYQVYSLARGVKRCFREVKNDLRKRRLPENSVITLYPEGTPKGRVLFSYNIKGFFLDPDVPLPKTHTNIWQSVKMAETFVELGYEVDVIYWKNNSFVPQNDYAFFFDVRRNLELISPLLNKDCTKIMHLDTAHILFHNAAEAKRLLELQKRRGVTLRPRRWELPNQGIENTNYATTTGNDFTIGTFQYANKKIFKLPVPCGIMLDWQEKEWDRCRKNFLWFSSWGLVHKGLDLALEAFREMPDCHLTVCGPVDKDEDFVSAYYKELYETRNIKTIGWVDLDSREFREITRKCVAMLHLSCSEGGGASVKMCMHGGLIPIVSYESSVDVHNFGFMLRDNSIDSIINIIKHVSSLSQSELKERAYNAWEFARLNYTRANFVKEFRKVISEIIEEVQS